MEQQSVKKYYAHMWLDDFRPPMIVPTETIAWAKTYDEFVAQVKAFGKDISDCIVHFDHDLGEGKDGYDCAKFLINHCIDNGYDVPDHDIQSVNPVGRENIESLFNTYNKIKDD